MPAFAYFLPLPAAVALTALVHFLSKVFKLAFTLSYVDRSILIRFGLPSLPAAIGGAALLGHLGEREAKLSIAVLILAFVALEILPPLRRWQVSTKYLSFGGALSGFFGGISGHQGALRTLFLKKTPLTKEGFIATTAAIACAVDGVRIPVYISYLTPDFLALHRAHLAIGASGALLGTFAGKTWLPSVSREAMDRVIAAMLAVTAVLMMVGVI